MSGFVSGCAKQMTCVCITLPIHMLLRVYCRQTSTVYRRISIVNGPVLPGVERGVAVLPPSKFSNH
jgi:hypothetical protein